MASHPPHDHTHRQRPRDPASPPDAHDLGYQSSTDADDPHHNAGVRSSTGSAPGAQPAPVPPGFTMWPNWLRDRLTSDRTLSEPTLNRAIRLYLELRGRFTNFHTGRGTPRRDELADALGTSIKSIERTLDVLRRVGAIRTTRLYDRLGHVTGMEYRVFGETGPDPQPQSDTTVAQEQPKATGESHGEIPKKKAKATGESLGPKRHPSPSLSDTGVAASTDQDLEDQDQDQGVVVVLDVLEDRPPPAQQQQQPTADDRPDDDGPPTLDECLLGFYAIWASHYDRAVYDRRTSDARHMIDIAAKAGQAGVPVLDLLASYLTWQDDALVVGKSHPLGLLAVNVGRVIAYHRARYPVLVETDDPVMAARRRMAASFGTPRWRH